MDADVVEARGSHRHLASWTQFTICSAVMGSDVMLHAVGRERVLDRGAHDRGREHAAAFAGALDAVRRVRRRRLLVIDGHVRRVHRRRQVVVLEVRVQDAALLVVLVLLHERRAEALHGAADDLAVERPRVDDRAGVVHGGVAQELELPGLGIDLDHGDVPGVADERVEDAEVGAIVARQRRQRVVVGRLRGEAALHVGRQVEPEHVRAERDLGQRELAVGHAAHAHRAVAELEVALGDLELVGDEALDLVLELGRGARHGARDHDRVARAAGTGAGQRVLRVGVGHRDRARVDVELLGHDLRDDGLGAVAPERLRVQRDDDAAGRVDLQARALGARGGRELGLVEPEPELGRAEDAALVRRHDADADVPALGAGALALGHPVVVVDRGEHLLEHALVVAAVVDVAGRRAVRELRRPRSGCGAGCRRGRRPDPVPRGRRAARSPSC